MSAVGSDESRGNAASGGGGAGDNDRAAHDCARGDAEDLTCADVIGFLDDYIAGNLAADRQAAFEAHLAICPQCVDYIASYRRTIELVRDSAPDAADRPTPTRPPPLPPALVRLIIAARRR